MNGYHSTGTANTASQMKSITGTDTTFITNEGEKSLRDRFRVLIKDTRFFDVLVGYFYTSGFLIFIGVGIAGASWIYLLWAVAFMILQHNLVIPEERMCIDKYGNAYREYINRTPKWIGIPKSH